MMMMMMTSYKSSTMFHFYLRRKENIKTATNGALIRSSHRGVYVITSTSK